MYRLSSMEMSAIKKSEYDKAYYIKNRAKLIKRGVERNKDPLYKKSKAEYDKAWWAKNRKRLIPLKVIYKRKRRQIDPGFRILDNCRRRVNSALHNIGVKKTKRTLQLLGVPNMEFLWSYLELKFTEGMDRKNYGKWEIDHIKPCYKFDLTKEKQQLLCFNYKNLQPLWSLDNRKKGKK